MRGDSIECEQEAGSVDPAGTGGPTRTRDTRRLLRGRVPTGAAVAAAAWVVPEIRTATPPAGATVSEGGWALHRWASRKPKVAVAYVQGVHAKKDGARRPGDSA